MFNLVPITLLGGWWCKFYAFFGMRHKSPNSDWWKGIENHNPNNAAVVANARQPTPPNEAPSNAQYTESASDPETPYTPLDVWAQEVKYSNESQRKNALMRISELDFQSPKFALPHNIKLLVRSLMEIFLSDRIIWAIKRHTNSYGSAKTDRFRAMSDADTFIYLLHGCYLTSGQVRLLEHQRHIDKAQSMIPHVIYRFKEIWANIHLYPVDQGNSSE